MPANPPAAGVDPSMPAARRPCAVLTPLRVSPVLAAALALVVLLAGPAQAGTTGDLLLRADGQLAASTAAAPSSCLQLTATGPATVSKAFTASLPHAMVADQTLALLLATDANPSAGTGFTLQGRLDVGGHAVTDTLIVAPGTGVPTPLRLAFTVPAAADVDAVTLTLTLTKSGAGPVAVAQALGIRCDEPGSRLAALTYTTDGPAIEPAGEGDGLSIPVILAIALVAGLVTLVAGALAIAGRTVSPRRIHVLLGATAGLLLAIAVLDLIPEAVELDGDATYTIVAGLLVLFLVRHIAGDHGHDHGGHEGHDPDDGDDRHANVAEAHAHGHTRKVATHAAGLAIVTFFALGFHRFVDGLVLPAAFELDDAVGLAAASAVLIHQFPDGIAAASLFLAAGWPRKRVLVGILVMALLTPVGALAGLALLGQDALVGHLIGLAAATFIFIPLAPTRRPMDSCSPRAACADALAPVTRNPQEATLTSQWPGWRRATTSL